MLHHVWYRLPAPLALLLTSAPALADIAPEPVIPEEPTSPMMLGLAAVVVVILALFVFRKLRR